MPTLTSLCSTSVIPPLPQAIQSDRTDKIEKNAAALQKVCTCTRAGQRVDILGAKHGFAQSMDCAAQNIDPYFYNDPWITCSIHGLHSAKGARLRFA